MTDNQMSIDEAIKIIDEMYQNKYESMTQKTENETIIDLSKMKFIEFTNLEFASVRALREVQSLQHKLENSISKDKIKAKIEDITNYYEKEVKPEMYHWGDFTAEEHYADEIAVLQELLEEN